MTANPTFPVSQEMFRDIVRLHVYGRTNEAIAKELGLELRVLLELRRDFGAEWDAAVEALIPSFTREMVFQTVAQIHILASLTTEVKELATLAHAEERHLRLVQGKKPRVKKPQPKPTPNSPTPNNFHHEDDTFTADEVAYVAKLRAENPNDLDYLCKLQQHEELYLKCFAAGILPAWPEPKPPSETPPTPPPEAPPKTFGQRLRSAAIGVLLLVSALVWPHPPNR